MERKKKVLIFFYITFTISLILVWGQSCFSREDSRVSSDIVVEMIKPIDELETGYRSENGWTYTQLSTYVRKFAHVIEYAALSFQLMCIFLLKGKRKLVWYVNCTFMIMLIALIDETIQIFSNRGSEIGDIWIDIAGNALGLLAAFIIGTIVIKRSQKERAK
ncbi:MAG: VanZ family protein [Lachnospiraceae bacterium]|nr:VanZ family protein [Lachnospiraceae bacterium]